MPAAIGCGAGATGRVEGAGDDERRRVDAAPSRSWSGSMLPCPAPRRLAARPAGPVAETLGTEPGATRPAAASVGWRRPARAPTRRRRPSIPSRSRRIGAGGVGGATGGAFASVGEAGRRALEDEAADGPRMRDGQPQRDPGPERVAEDVGRRRSPVRSRIAARSSAVRSTLARAGSAGMPERPCPGQVHDDHAEAPGEARSRARPSSSRGP